MRPRRIILAGLMAGMLSMSVFMTGCTSKQPETQDTTVSAAAQTTTVKPTEDLAAKQVKLTFVMQKPYGDESRQEQVETYLNEELKSKLPNTEIHFNFAGDNTENYNNKLNLMFAAGEEFDLLQCAAGQGNLTGQVSKQTIVPLDDLLKNYGQEILNRIEARYWPAVTYSGKIYSIPHPFVYSQPIGFCFKKELVDKYQFDYKSVKTIKDLEPFLKQIKEGEPGITPLLPHGLINKVDTVDMIAGQCGYSTELGKLTYESSPATLEMWKTMADYYKKGYVLKDPFSITSHFEECKSGKYAVTKDSGVYDASGAKSTALFGFPTYETFFSAFLIGTNKVQSVGTSISATSKNVERAMAFENLLYKDKTFSNHVAYGVEGEDYTVVSGAGTDKPVVKTQDKMKWAIWKCWIDPLWDQWGSNWNSYESLENMKKYTEEAPVSPLLGFTFNAEPVKKEIAQINPIVAERYFVLDMGAVKGGDVDKYYAETLTMLRAAGIDKVLEEMNKQLDAWKQSNH